MLTLKEQTMLGNIPNDWRIKPLISLLSSHYPGEWGEERGANMFKVLRSTNLTNDGRLDLSDVAVRSLKPEIADLLMPKRGDILLERSGGGPDQPVGRVGFVDSPMQGYAFSNFLHLLRPDSDRIHPRFLGWILWRINRTKRILRLEQQTTQMRNLNYRDYLSMPLPVPSDPEEQEAIACILDTVDKTIERTREAVEQAKKLKHSLVQNFLFEALGETAYANRPEKPLPLGWSLVPAEELLEKEPKNGISPTTNSQPPGIPTFSIAAIRDGVVDLDNVDNLKYAQISEKVAKHYHVAHGDLLIVRGNANSELVGKAGMVGKYPDDCIYPDITKRVVFKQKGNFSITHEYGLLVWNHSVVHNQVLRRAKTSNGTLKINNRDVRQIIIPVAPKKEQDHIVSLVQAASKKISALNDMVIVQQQLKRALMHDLLTGKVRVNHAIDKILSSEAS